MKKLSLNVWLIVLVSLVVPGVPAFAEEAEQDGEGAGATLGHLPTLPSPLSQASRIFHRPREE